ncbi:uncharacterized protein LOC108226176 [Daucus carota subsp. sativus]|nr:PREDICTED: uncharacterized protein LOC108226176 [Daucus carota subsp. sativus]
MYPICWAQVEAENNDSWEWFIRLLKEDLHMENPGSYTFICDRQKGLVRALETEVPEAEHRFCVMHLYKNLWKEHKGIGVRRLLWSAARSTTPYHFNQNMEALKKLAPRAYDWLAAKPKSQWSRSAFRDICKSDMFVNNNCEVFNNAINKFRGMGIVTMFIGIQNTCMERICKRLTKMDKRDTIFCTKPLKKLHKSMELAANARPTWNGGHKFLVTMSDGGHQIVVDLQNRSCACKKWQLTGIPCFHSCSCIFFLKENPLDYMHECHKKEYYLRVYGHILEPLNGEEFWEETFETPILPPKTRTAPGRPKKKRDKKSDIVQTRENNPSMLKRTGTSLKCSYCSEWGHNARTCQTKKIDEEKKRKEDGGEEGAGSSRAANIKKCSVCQQEGHNKKTCTAKEAGTSVAEKKTDPNQAGSTANKRKDSKAVVQPPAEASKQPTAANKVQRTAEVVNTTSHGGIFRKFKPPAQSSSRQCLGVEPIPGQKYTSLKNLQDAGKKKQKELLKKN